MRLNKIRPILLAVTISFTALFAVLGVLGAAPVQAASSDTQSACPPGAPPYFTYSNPSCVASLTIESQTVEMTFPDGSRRRAQFEGYVTGGSDGTASGTLQVDDGSQLVKYQITEWSTIKYDSEGRGIIVELVDVNGSVLEFKAVADPQQTGHRFEMNMDGYSIPAFQGNRCDLFYDAEGDPRWICWDEKGNLITS